MKTISKLMVIIMLFGIMTGCISQQSSDHEKEFKKLLLANTSYYAGRRLGIRYAMVTNDELNMRDKNTVKKVMAILNILSYDIENKEDIDNLIEQIKPELQKAGLQGEELDYGTTIAVGILSSVNKLIKNDENVNVVIENFRRGVATAIGTYGN